MGAYELRPEPYAFWASNRFPNGTPTTSIVCYVDPDHDGIPNCLQQFTDHHLLTPDAPSSALQLSLQNGYLALQYARANTADASKVFAERLVNLLSWTTGSLKISENRSVAHATSRRTQKGAA